VLEIIHSKIHGSYNSKVDIKKKISLNILKSYHAFLAQLEESQEIIEGLRRENKESHLSCLFLNHHRSQIKCNITQRNNNNNNNNNNDNDNDDDDDTINCSSSNNNSNY